jgi:ring-1,2-phenylacetyl-CoA epoxidase subunit PaaC
LKESRYHVRHSAEWVIRLGDGTEESALRTANALDDLTPYCAELFERDDIVVTLISQINIPDPDLLKDIWKKEVRQVLDEAGLLETPLLEGYQTGGRRGHHSDAMGHLLSQLQYMQRTFPDMKW